LEQLTSSQQDFLANLSASQEKENQRKMTEISGKKLSELSKSPDLIFLLEKMLMESLNSISTPYLRTWKVQTTPRGALIFQLRASVQNTKDKEYGLLPTPKARDYQGAEGKRVIKTKTGYSKIRQKSKVKYGASLNDVVEYQMMYPTPRSCDLEGGVVKNVEMNKGSFSRKNKKGVRYGVKLKDAVHYLEKTKTGGQLNPMWVEWLMGYPIGWTELDHSETA